MLPLIQWYGNHSFYFLHNFTMSVDIAEDCGLVLPICELYKQNNIYSKCVLVTGFLFLTLCLMRFTHVTGCNYNLFIFVHLSL